jgi:ankyrin repeat protein
MDRPPLHDAAARGDLEQARALLDAGAPVDEESSYEYAVDRSSMRERRTPLWIAIEAGHAEVACLLLDRGARIDAYDGYEKHTPLTLAATRGLASVVEKILARGPAPAELDDALARACGARPGLTRVVWDAARAEVVRALLDAGARSLEALWHAAFYGRSDVAELLVDAGVACERAGMSGTERSALLGAASGGRLAMFEWLLKRGADPTNVLDEALWLAAHRGDLAMVEAVLERGAAIDARAPSGWTALFYAANAGHGEVIRALLERGANRDIEDNQGKTARDWARDAAILD